MAIFIQKFNCFSTHPFLEIDRSGAIDHSGRIIMPPSVLSEIMNDELEWIEGPMLFKLTCDRNFRYTHVGVLEFTANLDRIHVPKWIMKNLLIKEGDKVTIESISLPPATHLKFQPQSVDFLDIKEPKVVLQQQLQKYACITRGDLIAIKHDDKFYELWVLDVKPEAAVTIIDCELKIDFAKPIGYKEKPETVTESNHDEFKEKCMKLRDEKIQEEENVKKSVHGVRGIPADGHDLQQLIFDHHDRPNDEQKSKKGKEEPKNVQG